MAFNAPMPDLLQDHSDRDNDSANDQEYDDSENKIVGNNESESDEIDVDTEDETGSGDEDQPRTRRRQNIRGCDNTTIWFTNPDPRPRPAPVRVIKSRAIAGCHQLTDPLTIFEEFITVDILNLVLEHTNRRILEERDTRQNMQPYETRVITREELKAGIGLLIFFGILHNSMVKVEDLWATNVGPAIFAATLSANRFRYVLRKLRFDNVDTRKERVAADRFALSREPWELFIQRCQRNFQLSTYVTLDETLLNFHVRCRFVVYMPNKPDRYGLKLISLTDASTPYFFNGIPYTGAGATPAANLSVPTRQALEVLEPIFNSNRNVTADNYFTCNELANELLRNGLTIIGTMRKNRREIPSRFLRARRGDVHKRSFLYQRDRILVGYVPKIRKAVVMLSTAHVGREQVNESNGKPSVINFYNRTKGGVDTVNQMLHSRTTYRKTKRWTLRYFLGMLEIAALNSFVMHRSNEGNLTRLQFLKQLAQQLVEPHIRWRLTSSQISRNLRIKIKQYLNLPLEDQIVDQPARAGRPRVRCKFCPRKKDRKATAFCYKCANPICGRVHRRRICTGCYSTAIF